MGQYSLASVIPSILGLIVLLAFAYFAIRLGINLLRTACSRAGMGNEEAKITLGFFGMLLWIFVIRRSADLLGGIVPPFKSMLGLLAPALGNMSDLLGQMVWLILVVAVLTVGWKKNL